ncbi:restriction endonuclease subunit S [Clostridium perfringens]
MNNYKLEELCEFIRNGASIKQFENAKGYPITRIETIADSYINLERVGYADIIDLSKYEDYLLNIGDILMSHINSEKHLGKTAIFENEDKKLIHGMNLLCIRPDKKLVSPKYLNYYFKSLAFKKQLPKITKKSVNQASFSVSDLKKLKCKIHSIESQKKIVKILDKSQELIDKRKKQIEKLDLLVKSKFIEMFGDVKKNNKQWETQKGSDLFVFSSGKGKPTANLSDKNEYRCYGGNGITGYSDEYLIDYDTLVVGRVGVYCGSIHRTIGKVWITDNAIYIKEFKKNLNLMYLEYLFINMNFNQYADYSGQPKITQKPLQNSLYVLPPIELQNQFADFVKQVDKLKFELEKSLKELEDNFNSLMQKAFKGELFN